MSLDWFPITDTSWEQHYYLMFGFLGQNMQLSKYYWKTTRLSNIVFLCLVVIRINFHIVTENCIRFKYFSKMWNLCNYTWQEFLILTMSLCYVCYESLIREICIKWFFKIRENAKFRKNLITWQEVKITVMQYNLFGKIKMHLPKFSKARECLDYRSNTRFSVSWNLIQLI